jgi:hypothetical protein
MKDYILFRLGLGGFPSGIICLMLIDNPYPPLIIYTVFSGLCIIFGKAKL